MSNKKNRAIGVRLIGQGKLVTALSVVTVLAGIASEANAVACDTITGTSGDDVRYGSDSCNDVFWMYAGQDTAYGYALDDDLHMGDGRDSAHGGSGQDDIWGGEGPTFYQEILKAGDGADTLNDRVGPDWETGCGGDGTDIFDFVDGDGNDAGYGGPHQYGHPDTFFDEPSSPYDSWSQDGNCPV
ncbi:MAG: hypothetical protein M3198_15400 [Actinomycetota bacterium]|nr:hypothetical protein [Actinomycetota bacterium]